MKLPSFPSTLEQLSTHIRGGDPLLILSSGTSTVIPWEKLEKQTDPGKVVSLAKLPTSISLTESGALRVQGPVTWKEAKEFCEARGRIVLTSPTEELACVLAGLATSATGERCFGFGNLRCQTRQMKYLDSRGELRSLQSSKALGDLKELNNLSAQLDRYDQSFQPFEGFKNAPFPRLRTETDLLTGTEGQLGVIIEAELETRPKEALSFLFVRLPRWEENFEPHLALFQAIQNERGSIWAAELVDFSGLGYVPEDIRIAHAGDVVFLEVRETELERVLNEVLQKAAGIQDVDLFEISETKYHALRKAVPRGIFEANSRKGVTKQGTDVQVAPEQFADLFLHYREAAKLGIPYTLFGHFGDAHLHFNFNLSEDQAPVCESYFESLYHATRSWKGSPFAEHGIGLLKQPFIAEFLEPIHREVFGELKRRLDPRGVFFPAGYMRLGTHS